MSATLFIPLAVENALTPVVTQKKKQISKLSVSAEVTLGAVTVLVAAAAVVPYKGVSDTLPLIANATAVDPEFSALVQVHAVLPPAIAQ